MSEQERSKVEEENKLKEIKKENKELKEFNKELEERKVDRDLKYIKRLVREMACDMGVHVWVIVGEGKKDGRRIVLNKCKRCGKDRMKKKIL